jgi:hypothetical protein
MPYSGIITAAPGSLNAILKYLTNATHDNHLDYELTPVKLWGVGSTEEFKAECKLGFRKNQRKGVGRPPEKAFSWVIVRFPDGANLTEDEKKSYEEAVIDCASMGGQVSAVYNWHENLYTGASDLNVLMPNFDKLGLAIRERDTDPLKLLRWTMDQLTDRLNLAREAEASEPIQTMQEIKKSKARERGEIDIVEALANLSPPPDTETALIRCCMDCRFEITRYNSDGDMISLRPEGKKKAKKFRISRLLEDIGLAVRRLISKNPKKKRKAAQNESEETGETDSLATPARGGYSPQL